MTFPLLRLALCRSASQNTSIAVVSSRLVFSVARDGVLPLSSWIGHVDSHRRPRNAVTVMFVFAADRRRFCCAPLYQARSRLRR